MPRPMPDWSSSIDPAKRCPSPWKSRFRAVEQGLDVRRGLVETLLVVDLRERHLDGDRVQAHHRVSRVPARSLG